MKIYFVRHGQDMNPDPTRLSDLDLPLSELGQKQAVICAERLQKELGAEQSIRIIASPRTRTKQTANIVANCLGVDPAAIHVDNRLLERDCASHAGQIITEIFSKPESELVAAGMEPYADLVARLDAFYSDILAADYEAVIIVSHSGNIKPFAEIAQANHASLHYDHRLPSPEDYVKIEQ